MNDPELEGQLLSTLLRQRVDVVLEHRISAMDFATSWNGTVYEAICAVALSSKPGSFVTLPIVRHWLSERGLLQSAGGERRLNELASYQISPDLGGMSRRVAQLARLRRLDVAAKAIELACSQGSLGEAESASARLVELLTAATDDAAGEYTPAELASRAFEHFAVNGKTRGILDVPFIGKTLGRPAPGSMVVIGGQTGAGKSSLVLEFADAYERSGEPAGIIGLEDPSEIWGERIIARASGVSLAEAERRGGVSKQEMASVMKATANFVELRSRWALLDQYDHLDVCAKMRRLVAQGCKVIFIDYLQQADRRDMKTASRAQVMAAIAKDWKSEAKRLGVPLFLCSQIARPKEITRNWEPSLHSLKETGDLENMAEAVILLWKTDDTDDAKTLGKLAKHKSGGARPRFEILRNQAGAISGIIPYEAPTQEASRRVAAAPKMSIFGK